MSRSHLRKTCFAKTLAEKTAPLFVLAEKSAVAHLALVTSALAQAATSAPCCNYAALALLRERMYLPCLEKVHGTIEMNRCWYSWRSTDRNH